jgi:hypothetical protein
MINYLFFYLVFENNSDLLVGFKTAIAFINSRKLLN